MLSSIKKTGCFSIYISRFRDIVISTLSLKILVRLKKNLGEEINKFRIRPNINLLKFARTYKKGQYYQPLL
jgi:hypothetical protein